MVKKSQEEGRGKVKREQKGDIHCNHSLALLS